ncbi:MAG: NRDE family protein [Alphaproteobacteria bacterium]|nr:NRDE family protein [Alphaproteobacteria bacterium]
MCTLTIWRDSDHFTITMNRDDEQTRQESPPTLQHGASGAFISPRDVQAGGSWIAANDRGLIACLLNRYDPAPQGRISRGDIVLRAMEMASAKVAALALSPSPGEYSPFNCLLIDREHSVRLDWNGAHITRETLAPKPLDMLTSSSWQELDVRAQRTGVMASLTAGVNELGDVIDAFHCHTEADSDAWTPMMQRPTSHTKSITRVRASLETIEMSYWRRDSAVARGLTEPDVVLAIPFRADAHTPAPTDAF